MTRIIDLNASDWTEKEHFWRAILSQLHAPDWHGHNLDALSDSIVGGGVNGVQPPFHVRITNITSAEIEQYLKRVKDVFADARREGVDVNIEIG